MHRPRISTLTIAALMLALSVLQVRWAWIGDTGHAWDRLIRSDVRGYYGYLLAVFIRGDLGHEPPDPTYVHHTPDGTLNKYFAGTAVMMAPWFAAGHAVALWSADAPKDGRSGWEHMAIGLGGLVHVLLGLLLLRALLAGLGVRDPVIAWVLAATVLATPLLPYATMQPGWSHVHSFLAFAAFLFLVHRLADDGRMRWLILLGPVFGLIVLIRPVNGLVLLAVPIVAGHNTRAMIRRVLRRPLHLVTALAAFAAVVGIQPLLWHAQTGHWVEWGYRGEGFHWDRPEVLRVLFGFRRGLFLYAPVLLFAMAALFALRRRAPVVAWSGLIYFAVNTYVIASWWIWYYGSGFGSRVFVDHYPVLALPIAFVLRDASPRWLRATRVFVVACCALLLFQMWQYNTGILHPESMDREKYAFTFGRRDASYRGALGGNYQAPPFNPNGMSVVLEESCDFEHACAHWGGGAIRHRDDAFSGGNAAVFDGKEEFGLGFEAGTDELPTGRALYLEIGLQRYEARSRDSHPMLCVTDVRNARDEVAFYEPFAFNPMPGRAGAWEQLEYRIPVPPLFPGERLKFYFWDRERRSRVLIDDVFIRVWAVNPY